MDEADSPGLRETLSGLAVTEKSKAPGPTIASVNVAVLCNVPLTPATLIVYVPGGVWDVVAILRVDVKGGVPLVGDMLALISGSRPASGGIM
jgi:hypothetical protein